MEDWEREEIADLAAKKVFDLIYAEIGKSVLKKFIWFVGIIAVAIFFYLARKGIVQSPL